MATIVPPRLLGHDQYSPSQVLWSHKTFQIVSSGSEVIKERLLSANLRYQLYCVVGHSQLMFFKVRHVKLHSATAMHGMSPRMKCSQYSRAHGWLEAETNRPSSSLFGELRKPLTTAGTNAQSALAYVRTCTSACARTGLLSASIYTG